MTHARVVPAVGAPWLGNAARIWEQVGAESSRRFTGSFAALESEQSAVSTQGRPHVPVQGALGPMEL